MKKINIDYLDNQNIKTEIPVNIEYDEEKTQDNEKTQDIIYNENKNIFKYLITFIFLLVFFILLGYIYILNNQLNFEKSKPKTIEQIANENIKKATYIKNNLEKEINILQLNIRNKQIKLNQTNWCLENTNSGQVVNCYIFNK